MIEITPISYRQHKFMTCNSCGSDLDVRNITVGLDKSSTVSIRLCIRCRAELKTLIDEG